MEKLFSQPGIPNKWKKNCFQQQERMFLPGAIKFLSKNFLPHSINNGFNQQKTLDKRILFHLDTKGF